MIPGYARAVVAGGLAAFALAYFGHPVDTIGSRFTYEIGSTVFHGVPRMPPSFVLPWELPGPRGARSLSQATSPYATCFPAAVSIAMLGAIESLLCAVVLDRSTGTRHHSNGELLGQGLANIAAPFFGGVPSTAAIARSAANAKAGARTPLAAAIHSLFVPARRLGPGPCARLHPYVIDGRGTHHRCVEHERGSDRRGCRSSR